MKIHTPRLRNVPALAIGALVPVGLALLLAGTVAAAPSSPTKGPIPSDALRPGGTIDAAKVPDFVSVAGRDGGIVGYVTKEVALNPPIIVDASGRPEAGTAPVYGADLTTVVGEMVPGKGFIPLGVDPASVPEPQVSVAPAP